MSRLLLLLLFCASCATPLAPKQKLEKEFIAISGTIKEIKKEDNFDRIFIRLTSHSDEDVLAVAYNDDNFDVLTHVFSTVDVGDIVIFYGTTVNGPWQDIYFGLDIEVMAIEYKLMGRSIIVDTRYGDRVRDQLEMKSIFKFIGRAGGRAVKSAF